MMLVRRLLFLEFLVIASLNGSGILASDEVPAFLILSMPIEVGSSS